MRLYFLLLILFAQNLPARTLLSSALSTQQMQIFIQLSQYNGPKTFLLSYPRSGNTWMRYCLEYHTKRPTLTPYNPDPMNRPLGWLAGFELDCTKPPIQKIHIMEKYNKEVDTVILLIRNPKEAFKRQGGGITLTKEIFKRDPLLFDNIALYDSWNPHKRILVYYEDLLKDPKGTMERVLDFLQEPYTKIPEFLANYELHQQKAIEIYKPGSRTKAKDLLFHSRGMTAGHRKQIDQWLEELYPMQWNLYLKHKFGEEVLDYKASPSTAVYSSKPH